MNHPYRLRPCLRAHSPAFTLIELLVVIGIVGVLAAVLLPVYGHATRQGHLTATVSNMRQMGIAFISYANDNNYQLPGRVRPAPGTDNTPQHKWIISLQPYYQDTRVLVSPIDAVGGVSYKVTDPKTLLSDDVNNTSYIANGYNDLGAYNNSDVVPRTNNIAEPSNTILLGVPYPRKNNFYMDFQEHNESDILNRTAFDGSSVYVFSDGSARPLKLPTTANGSTVDMKKKPPTSGLYTDWLWLVDKNATIGN